MTKHNLKMQQNVTKDMLANIIKHQSFNDTRNYKHAVDIIFNNINDHSLEALIHLIFMNDEYKVTKVGDYVRLPVPKYHAGTEFEYDVLDDIGLLGEGDYYNRCYVYGQVISDTNWDKSSEYDPFYQDIKVNLLYHDDDKNLKFKEYTCSPLSVAKVKKKDILHFNPIIQTKIEFSHGKDHNEFTTE
tara:strand:- start:4335 stop:4895 length:561 start_codon:yes stop_codon:yes gene_type:complete